MDERPALLVNLPTSVRGFCFHDDDGEPHIPDLASLYIGAIRNKIKP